MEPKSKYQVINTLLDSVFSRPLSEVLGYQMISLDTHTQHYVDFSPLNLKPHEKSPPIPKQYADFVSLGFVSLSQAPKII